MKQKEIAEKLKEKLQEKGIVIPISVASEFITEYIQLIIDSLLKGEKFIMRNFATLKTKKRNEMEKFSPPLGKKIKILEANKPIIIFSEAVKEKIKNTT